MKIKKTFIPLLAIGLIGVSSYAMAEGYMFRANASGASSSLVDSDNSTGGDVNDGTETPESNLTSPGNFIFSENNDQLSGNVGDAGTVTLYDELGTEIGQTTSDATGNFTLPLGTDLSGGDVINVVVTNGTITLSSNTTIPEIETDVACYDPENVGKIGTYQGCEGLLIVEDGGVQYGIERAIETGILVDGKTYGATDIFTGQVTNMSQLFMGTNFNEDIGYWDTSNVRGMAYMFSGTTAFNQNINNWDTSSLVSMNSMFRDSSFNSPIGKWNTSNVTQMIDVFYNAKLFNQDISQWDVSSVQNMNYMFRGATAFNQPIGNWNTSSVKSMYLMFTDAENFNKDIGNWNTSNVERMGSMFTRAYAFNQDIGNWDTSNVYEMSAMFQNADSFNQDISGWDTSNVTTMNYMFQYALSFNQNLAGWCVSKLSSKPSYFDMQAIEWVLPRPTWGSCSQ